jgi:hypothetical protein
VSISGKLCPEHSVRHMRIERGTNATKRVRAGHARLGSPQYQRIAFRIDWFRNHNPGWSPRGVTELATAHGGAF